MATRAALRTSVLARGLDFTSSTRVNEALDAAVRDLTTARRWTHRVVRVAVLTSGTSVSNLGPVHYVQNARGARIPESSQAAAEAIYGEAITDATQQSGRARTWWRVGRAIHFAPKDPEGVTVTHLTRAGWTSGSQAAADDNDTPILDSDADDVIIDAAVARLYEDGNEAEHAQVLNLRVAKRVQELEEIFGLVAPDEIVHATSEWL